MQKENKGYLSIAEEIIPEVPRYLKYWGLDYPYLTGGIKDDNSLFPVPVDSNAHKHLIQLNKLRRMV